MSIDERTDPQPIPAPEDFPITWESPADEASFWTIDRMHWPDQMTPLEYTLLKTGFCPGFVDGFAFYDAPIAEYATRRINTYVFQCVGPRLGSPEEMQAMGERAQQKLGAAMARVGEQWEHDLLPEVLDHLRHWESFDLDGASGPELADHLADAVGRMRRMFDLHFRAILPAYLALSELDECYREASGDPDTLHAFRLVQGFGNKTVETGHMLWKLSRRALASAEVMRVLEHEAASDVVVALEATDDGRAFLAELREYLATYGQRSDKWTMTTPSWVEDPAPAIKMLKDYVTQPDSADPAGELERLSAERDDAVAQARLVFDAQPPDVRGKFEFLLNAAQAGIVITEDHGFYIDFRGMYQVRRIVLACGRRLAADGAIDAADDVWMLPLDELLDALRDAGIGRRDTVRAGRDEMERFAAVAPPPGIGTMPAGPPPDNPVMRSLGKLFGQPPVASDEEGVVRGTPGSPGVVRGVARVICSLREAERLQPGEILVAETTAPPWTPLFAAAGGLVCDTGGTLSHCAVVAREYGIPAVVGTISGTSQISDGQTIEVDGDSGVVRIVAMQ